MMLVPCPWCGSRNVSEFVHVGESDPRPDPAAASRQEWRSYLYERDNPAGVTAEYWYHRAGCRQYFLLERDTVANDAGTPDSSQQERMEGSTQ